jgi:hypothetical protein
MSFRNKLSQMWGNIQSVLFPDLVSRVGELSILHKKLISILELIRIEEFLPCNRFNNGRIPKDRPQIARSYIAKIVFKLQDTKQLAECLKRDEQLRVICGWERSSTIPSLSKFSRVFHEFASISLPNIVHEALIKEVYKDELILHLVKDSTPIEAREKALKKELGPKERKKINDRNNKRRKRAGELNRRAKQLEQKDLNKMIEDLPKACDKGMKRSAQGYTTIWKGYKLHAAVDDNCIPITALVTSASLNDCEVAIPLAEKASLAAKNLYDLMDSAYDHIEIKRHCESLGHVAIIDPCPHNKVQKIQKEAEREGKKLFKTAKDIRYKNRFPKERFNAVYKDYHGGRTIYYRGHEKISCHVMFGVLVLAASTLIKIIT